MPLVFVHGVANRLGENYQRGMATRDAYFRRFLLSLNGTAAARGRQAAIRNPYWGDLGGRLCWGGASLPLESFESLGADDAAFAALQAAADPEGAGDRPAEALLTVARRSLPDAVDLLWSAAALSEAGDAEAVAGLGAAAYAYAAGHPSSAWLAEVRTDQDFVARLQQEVAAGDAPAVSVSEDTGYESLGLADGWNAVRRGAARLRTAAVGMVGRSASDRIRPAAIPPIAAFLGDVFVYLHEQESVARPIGRIVEADFRAAAAARTDDDPFVVVAHSMGGIITYDLLTSTAADLRVDLLVTVGTQVGFFEELKLFRSSDPSIPGDDPNRRVPRPAAVKRWINVFDYSDLLGFEVGSIIDGVTDYSYRTGSLLRAHSTYFIQPGFHHRLAARAAQAPA